jgi:DNA-binding transcriptional regulator GbsR (MarR family)
VQRKLIENSVVSVEHLNQVELEVTRLFVQLSRALGQPPSVGEIYGLLFISPKPLTMADRIERLRLSNGSASQGLRYLRELGAMRGVAVAGARRTHYEAVAELRKLAGNFLRQQISPPLSDNGNRLQQIMEKARKLTGEAGEHVLARIKLLMSWEENACRVLPFMLAVLDS